MLLAMIVVYFAVMIAIGIFAAKHVQTSEGYYLGGKGFGPWFTAFKFAATLESGTKLVGTPGMAYGAGYVAFLQGITTPLANFLSFRVFGQRLKMAFDHYDVVTVPQLLERRYGNRVVRMLASIAILVGLGGSIISQFKASGEVFSSILHTNYLTGLFIGVAVVGFYSVVGGYLATVWTDLLQGLVMVVGVIILLIATVTATFGSFSLDFLGKMNAALGETNPRMLLIDGGGAMPVVMIITFLVIGSIVGVAQPQQAVAIFTMKDRRVAKSAMIISTLFSTILIWCLLPSAMMGKLILNPESIPNPDALMPTLAQFVLGKTMAGLFMAAILSAIMSTVSGLIVVASSSLSQDIINILAPQTYEKNKIAWDRGSAAAIVIICLLLAIRPPSIIFWITLFAFGFTVFTFIMPMFGIVLWRKATGKAAVIQMIVTMILIPVWQIMPKDVTGGISGLTVGMIVAPIVFIIVSLLTKNSNEEDLDQLWNEYSAAGIK